MRVGKFLIAGLLVLSTVQIRPCPAQAASTSAAVRVHAVIRPWIKFSATQPAGNYRVAAEDLRRGHLDLPRAITIRVESNTRGEIRLDVVSGGPGRILVQTEGGLTDTVRMTVKQPAVPIIQVLDLRIVLPADVGEGDYPLQVAFVPVAY